MQAHGCNVDVSAVRILNRQSQPLLLLPPPPGALASVFDFLHPPLALSAPIIFE